VNEVIVNQQEDTGAPTLPAVRQSPELLGEAVDDHRQYEFESRCKPRILVSSARDELVPHGEHFVLKAKAGETVLLIS
jgi:hypothetical protein